MEKNIGAVPTLVYPESDGEPMAETPKHQQVMIDCMDILRRHFQEVPDVYIAGNMFLYYEEGNPRKSVSPDVFMVRGLGRKDLRVYKTWEQPPTLDFVLEVASPSTFEKDFTEKKTLYAEVLRVKEYYIYDPYYEIDPAFIGFRLVGEAYQEIPRREGRFPSEVLGLELAEREGLLRFYDPVTSACVLPSPARVDAAEARAATESRARSEAEARAAAAETELAALRTALKRLQTPE